MDLGREKEKLIRNLISEGYLKTPRITEAFRKVKREEFVLPTDKNLAYVDYPLSIPGSQTISAPHMCAIMLEFAGLNGGEKILEVGAGSGYNAALMAEMVGKKGKIITIELDPELSVFARKNLEKGGYNSVIVLEGDGSKGYAKNGPYDLIMVTCATSEIYKTWINQLKEGGKIIAPVGGGFGQELITLKKTEEGLKKERRGGCIFVPLRHQQ